MNALILLVKGFLIGIANIIPGVSGGTFALILGIFDRLVDAIKSIDAALARSLLGCLGRPFSAATRETIAREWKRTDAAFLVLIACGAVLSLVSCAWLFDYLLRNENYPSETFAFFIGLIVPSIVVPYRMMEKRGAAQLFWILPGAALIVGLAFCDVTGSSGDTGYPLVFLGGALAISAMILPGVSGSFILLILGLYQPTLGHIKDMSHAPSTGTILYLASLGLGCVLGLAAFARFMSFLLKRYRSATLAFLIGLIIGSFWVLWPFKDFESGVKVAGSGGETKQDIAIATAPNRLPGDREGDGALILRCGAALVIGLAGAAGVSRLGRVKES